MTAIRYDAATIGNVKRTPQGGLRVDARLTRVGVLEYRRADGTVVRELRHPDEVFRADSLDSLRGAPVTDLHPSDMVRTDNFAELARGHVGDDVRQDAERYVAATLYVQDARLVEAIESGDRREISCGYTCDYDPTPGEWNGERYDGQQRNITYNHAAIGPRAWGRAGSEVALRMDAASICISGATPATEEDMAEKRKDAEADAPAVVEEEQKATDASTCATCGAPVDAEGKYAAPAAEVEVEAEAPMADGKAEKMDSLRGRLDAKEAEIADLRRRLDEANAPARIARLVAEAVEVREVAKRAGVERVDGLDTHGVRLAVIEKVTGIKCADRSPDYVAGLYDAATRQIEARGVAHARATVDSTGIPRASRGLIEEFRVSVEESQKRNTNQKKEAR